MVLYELALIFRPLPRADLSVAVKGAATYLLQQVGIKSL